MVLTHLLKVPFFGCWTRRGFTVANTFKAMQYMNQAQRFKSNNKTDCSHLVPKCGDRFKPKPCDPSQQQIILKQPAPKPLPEHKRTIEVKRPIECCGNPCLNAFPRFDSLYYRRSDKLSREYQQTWAECPELVKKPKVICCLKNIRQPKMKRRPRQQRPATACQQVCTKTKTKCPNIRIEGCPEANIPPKCRLPRLRTICKKRRAPFPAFSECMRKMARPRHPIECRCLLTPSMCEVWSYYHYTSRIKKIGLC